MFKEASLFSGEGKKKELWMNRYPSKKFGPPPKPDPDFKKKATIHHKPPRPDHAFERKNFEKQKYALRENEQFVYDWLHDPSNVSLVESRRIKHTMADMDEFALVDGKSLSEDKRKVIERRNEYRDKTERGYILEEIGSRFFAEAGYFGDFKVSTTTAHDDRRGIDMVLSDGNGVNIGIDFTVTEGQQVLLKKFNNIKKKLADARLSSVKYYQSPEFQAGMVPEEEKHMHLTRLNDVPRIVVAIPTRMLDEICGPIAEIIKSKQSGGGNLDACKAKLSQHPVLLFVLLQIESQLKKQLEIMDSNFVEVEIKKDDVQKNEMQAAVASGRQKTISEEDLIVQNNIRVKENKEKYEPQKESRKIIKNERNRTIVEKALEKIQRVIEEKKSLLGEDKIGQAQKNFSDSKFEALMESWEYVESEDDNSAFSPQIRKEAFYFKDDDSSLASF